MNTTVSGSTGFTPLELLLEKKKPDLFEGILNKSPENLPEEETTANKVMKAFARMKKKARDRRERRKAGNRIWEPRVNEQVLVRAQQTSDAAIGVTAKFIHPYVYTQGQICVFSIVYLAKGAYLAIAGARVSQMGDVMSRDHLLEHSMKSFFVLRHATSDYASLQSTGGRCTYVTCCAWRA